MKKVRTAVIAVAGFGTRMLPATKAQPKELLTIVRKPIVQYLVEEAAASGIENVVLVTRAASQSMMDHFGAAPGLEAHLAARNDQGRLAEVRRLAGLANLAFVRQGDDLPYGNGSPILAARPFLAPDEPFVYMFGDDLVLSDVPCTRQVLDLFEAHGPEAVVAAQAVPREETSRYGIVKLRPGVEPKEMETVVEKPRPSDAPSTLAQLGRFVLTPRVVEILARREVGKDRELWLADAIAALCRSHRVLVHEIAGAWLTTGDPLSILRANVEYALKDPEVGPALRAYLRGVDLT